MALQIGVMTLQPLGTALKINMVHLKNSPNWWKTSAPNLHDIGFHVTLLGTNVSPTIAGTFESMIFQTFLERWDMFRASYRVASSAFQGCSFFDQPLRWASLLELEECLFQQSRWARARFPGGLKDLPENICLVKVPLEVGIKGL